MRDEANKLIKYAADIIYFHHTYGRLGNVHIPSRYMQVNIGCPVLLEKLREIIKIRDIPTFPVPITNRRCRENFGAPGPIIYYNFRKNAYENCLVVSGKVKSRITLQTKGNEIDRIRFWKKGLPDVEIQLRLVGSNEPNFAVRILNKIELSLPELIDTLEDYHTFFEPSNHFVTPPQAEAFNLSPFVFRQKWNILPALSAIEIVDSLRESDGVPSLLRCCYASLSGDQRKGVPDLIVAKLTMARIPQYASKKRKRFDVVV